MTDVTALGLAGLVCLLASSAAGKQVTVGDNKCSVILDTRDGALVEQGFLSNGQPIAGLTGTAWLLHIDDKRLTPTNAEVVSADRRRASFAGQDETISWRMTYEVTGPGRITKTLTITPKRDLLLSWVYLWDANSAVRTAVAQAHEQGIAAFYRYGKRGLFVSLDFPYSKVLVRDETQSAVAYPPHVSLRDGETYECHSLTFGATMLTGEKDPDRVAAFIAAARRG